ncbi:MAG: hypothetical protein C5B48_01845 [Candidatus Rokuibacteriota bacterium]|nr:MAG: hypothetical protein C5B48_01845 [Candidatus Rokubacteria bacterium]
MARPSTETRESAVARAPVGSRPLLTVVVPVYNGGDRVVENVETIRRAVAEGLPGEELELIVVSDGSIDDTGERLLATRSAETRVIHYDRNLGKGYAVKVGALASRGEWIAMVDADLDLDPAAIPDYLRVARRDGLDFAIGSKLHPDSVVSYPRSRRVASWCYQQLNRALFRLEVRDTQVGLKVFRRPVVEEVLPLLLVKQFAFDLELLAVATTLGHARIAELPVRLEYRFSGSQLGSRAVARALWDTVAIFYRLRILRTYQRKRALLGAAGALPPEQLPPVELIGDAEARDRLDYARLQVGTEGTPPGPAELCAILEPSARPASNWVSATVPYFGDRDVAAVVAPTVAPLEGPLRAQVAAAVLESRLGGGSRRSGHFPGNVRVVSDHPAGTVVVRRADYAAALESGVDGERLVAWLAERGRRTIYTPDTSVSAAPPPLVGPHLRGTVAHARARGVAARRSAGTSMSRATALSLAPAAGAVVGASLLAAGGDARRVGAGLIAVYGATVSGFALLAGVRFRSPSVGLFAVPALVATQGAYVAGFVAGIARGR